MFCVCINISFLSNKSNSSNRICLEKFFFIFIFVSSNCYEIVNLTQVDCFWIVGNIDLIETFDYRYISNRIKLCRSLKLYKCQSVRDSSLFHRLQKPNIFRIVETFILTTVFRLRFVTVESIALPKVEKVTEWRRRRRPEKIVSNVIQVVGWITFGDHVPANLDWFASNIFQIDSPSKCRNSMVIFFSYSPYTVSISLVIFCSFYRVQHRIGALEWNYTIQDVYAYE